MTEAISFYFPFSKNMCSFEGVVFGCSKCWERVEDGCEMKVSYRATPGFEALTSPCRLPHAVKNSRNFTTASLLSIDNLYIDK